MLTLGKFREEDRQGLIHYFPKWVVETATYWLRMMIGMTQRTTVPKLNIEVMKYTSLCCRDYIIMNHFDM